MGGRFLMALDAGGGSGRCLLVDVDTGATFTAQRDWTHPSAPDTMGLGFDLDIDDLWRRLGEAAREALQKAAADPGEVLGIAATSMRNTTVILDGEGRVLLATPNQDARSLAESLALGAERGSEVHGGGGHWPSPLFTGARLLWARNNMPQKLERARAVLSLSDWVAFRLGGEARAEVSQAGETLLFDLAGGDWSSGLIESLGLRRDIFPRVVEAGTPIGALSPEAAGHLGLRAGMPIAAGGADTQCGLLGAQAVEEGDLGIVAGTTLPVQLVTRGLVLDPDGRLWSGAHVIPGMFVLESNGMTAGYVLEWFANILYCDYDRPLQVLMAEAARSEPGAAGVYSTLGACVFDACTIGIPVGNLTMSHMVTAEGSAGRRHVGRALLEGIAYSARANVEQIQAVAGSPAARIKALGGISRSRLWTGMLSDVLGRELSVSLVHEVSALGAAVCAGVGAGVFGDLVEGARALGGAVREHAPGADSPRYQGLYSGWREAMRMRAECDTHVSGLMTAAMLERPPQAESAADAGTRPRMMVTAVVDEAALAEMDALGEVTYSAWREAMKVYDGGRELIDALRGYGIFVTEMDVVDFEAIRGLPDLKVVVVCRGNPVNVDIEAATAHGIMVIGIPGRNADAVADLTAAFMVMLARKLPEASRFLKQEGGEAGDLARMADAYVRFEGKELWRKTVGIVGLGEVGSRVAGRARSCGAEVLFFDPAVSEEDGALCNAVKVSFEELLARSDFVTLHAPKNEATRGMMDRAAFAAMKDGAFFINTARASLVDEDALREALESGRLAGAALDVFAVEPPARDDPIVSRENVIATPHVGGNTFEIAAHQGASVAAQLRKLLAGERPDHVLNPAVMETFSWTAPRPEPPADELERLAARPRPAMTS